ncbi:MAG: Cas10/Cmr2 second palm domain-containing protein, partial [Bryobacteraceae bacterium]
LLGSEEFLTGSSGEGSGVAHLLGRCAWLNLICEVLPRALLSDLKLSRMLLGSSSAEQFLLVLAEDDVPRANVFLNRAAAAIARVSAGMLRLVWATTENLGAWPAVRKRLDDALMAAISAPLVGPADMETFFQPFTEAPESGPSPFADFAEKLPSASRIGWTSDALVLLTIDGGQYSWPLRDQSFGDEDAILFPRRCAMDDTGSHPASLAELARRASGAAHWGILRGDVDHFDFQLRRAVSVEDHIQLSVLLKEFFAGELAVLCSLPDFWRKVTVLYRGGDDFIVAGAWDALILLAREIARLFEAFVQQNLESLPSLEGKTIGMALAIAPEIDAPLATVLKDAGAALASTKAAEPGTFSLFGRMLEWKRLRDAEDLASSLLRLVREFGYSAAYINDLASVYREAFSARACRRAKVIRLEKPWRTYMRVSRVIPPPRTREAAGIRNAIVSNLTGTRASGWKLLPSARVALEWARLAAGAETES